MTLTNDEKFKFLTQRLEDMRGTFSTRLLNGFKESNIQTFFSALRYKKTKFEALPHLGPTTFIEFRDFVFDFGFSPGDTETFILDENANFFMRDKHFEKQIVDAASDDPNTIFIEDYKTIIAEFLDPSLKRTIENEIKRNLGDKASLTDVLIAATPQGYSREFMEAAMQSPEVLENVVQLLIGFRRVAVKAIESHKSKLQEPHP